MDYHFGRLSPERGAAVEAHVRSCAICQREGLDHARTRQQIALRQLESVRAARPSAHSSHLKRLMRPFALALLLLALLGVSVTQLPSWLHREEGSTLSPPAPLVARLSLALSTTGAAGVASDPSGSLIAVAAAGPTATVTIWRADSGLLVQTLRWPGSAEPASLAWSPNGGALVASDGLVVGMWSLSTGSLAWAKEAPAGTSAAIFASVAGQIVDQPPLAQELAAHAFLQWGADSSLVPAPAGAAAPLGATLPGGALVGMWRATGSHLFVSPGGGVAIGDGSTSSTGNLDWSPDGRYVLWSRVAQPVALPRATGQPASQGAPPPNPTLAAVAARLLARGTGDALAWLTPDDHALALCDRSGQDAPLEVVDLASGRVIYALSNACAGVSVSSATWLTDGAADIWTLVLALPAHPVQECSVRL